MKAVDAIRALARTSLTASQHRDCSLALGSRAMVRIVDGALVQHQPTAKERREAHGRCLALIAARRAAIRSLRRFAISHGEVQFARMCTAALNGEEWARGRLGFDWGGGIADMPWDGAALLAIRTMDATRPDHAAVA